MKDLPQGIGGQARLGHEAARGVLHRLGLRGRLVGDRRITKPARRGPARPEKGVVNLLVPVLPHKVAGASSWIGAPTAAGPCQRPDGGVMSKKIVVEAMMRVASMRMEKK